MNADHTTVPVHARAPQPDAFPFGRNWGRYVATHLDAGRESIAAESLGELVGDLRGKTFLDIGCGSGLFSLCAYCAGATEVVSIDIDPDAVLTTRELHRRAGSPGNWRVLHRSILESGVTNELEPADIVYSWGVLHHTGDMYAAIRNASTLVNPGGVFAIAIYNRVSAGWLTSERWWRIKRAYNHSPRGTRRAMELAYWLYWLCGRLRHRQSPFRVAREYRQSRGMALSTDVRDWLGGYPYEFATVSEVIDFCERACGLRCVRVIRQPEHGTGNNQFVFTKP